MPTARADSASIASGANLYAGRPNPAPAWRVGQAVGEWREISGSAMSLLSPTNTALTTAGGAAVVGPTSRMDAWCGLSIDTRSDKVWAVANGGHGDYYGNEVCVIDLAANSPAWAEALAGSSGNVVDAVTTSTDRSHARYLEAPGGTAGTGLPCSTHSYYGQQFIESHGRAIRLGGSTSPLGSAFENVEAFNVVTGAWDNYNANTEAPPYGYCIGQGNNGWTVAIGWSACRDPRNDKIYVPRATTLRVMTPSATAGSATWADFGTAPFSPNTGAYGATAVDTTRDRLVWMLGDGGGIEIVHWDLATGTPTTASFPASAATTAIKSATDLNDVADRPGASGLVYVEATDKFYLRQRHAGATVYEIDPATFAVSVLGVTGGGTIPEFVGFSGEQGVYNRFLCVPLLSGIVYFPNASANAWFLRTH